MMRALTSDAEMVLAKADFGIAKLYSELAGPLHDEFFPQIEKEFEAFINDLKWQLIKDSIIKENSLTVTPEEISVFAVQMARAQYNQYGIFDIPDEQLESFAKMILEKPEEVALLEEEEENGLTISGSVDTYWKYDFSGYPNISTSFADEQNSVSLGMVDLVLEQTVGKASFVGEISFGPRNQSSFYGFNIQNLYMSYGLTDKVSLSAEDNLLSG